MNNDHTCFTKEKSSDFSRYIGKCFQGIFDGNLSSTFLLIIDIEPAKTDSLGFDTVSVTVLYPSGKVHKFPRSTDFFNSRRFW